MTDKNITDKKKELSQHSPQHKKPPSVQSDAQKEQSANFKGIVRLAGKDVRGNVKLKDALIRVRGIGPTISASVANAINKQLNIPIDKQIGELTDEELEKIDKILFNIADYTKFKFLLNRSSDSIDGTNKHVIMNDLIFSTKQDIEKEKKSYTWKGYRFSYGQKVRGQRTRNTGRTGMSVGVLRKAILAAAAQQKEPGKTPTAGAAAAAPAAGAKPTVGAKPAAAPAAKKEAAKPAEKK